MNRLFQTFILPLLVPVLIGIGTSSVLALRLEERIVSIERPCGWRGCGRR